MFLESICYERSCQLEFYINPFLQRIGLHCQSLWQLRLVVRSYLYTRQNNYLVGYYIAKVPSKWVVCLCMTISRRSKLSVIKKVFLSPWKVNHILGNVNMQEIKLIGEIAPYTAKYLETFILPFSLWQYIMVLKKGSVLFHCSLFTYI